MAKNDADNFISEQQQLVRALKDSLDREKNHLRQLRRLKECLVSTALKLQVASNAIKCDETTILYLRRDLQEARKQVNASSEKEKAASELIQSLRLEVLHLKHRVRETDPENLQFTGTISSAVHDADRQVNSMMQRRGIRTSEVTPIVRERDRPTAFQEWKMNKFIWAPDTPGGSASGDEHAVQELLHAAMHPPKGTGIYKMNKATLVKQRPGTTATSSLGNTRSQLPGLRTPIRADRRINSSAPNRDLGNSSYGHTRFASSPISRDGRPSTSIV